MKQKKKKKTKLYNLCNLRDRNETKKFKRPK